MFKNFPKINIFIIAIFVFGVMFGFLSGIEIGIKYLFENKTPTPPAETPKEETRTVTGWVKFRAYREEKIPFAPPPSPPPLPPLGFPGSPPSTSETVPSETTQQNDTNNATNSLEYVTTQIPVENVLLAIVGQDGKIIKTITTDKNGDAEIEITVPEDMLFSLTPAGAIERGVIHAVSFKEGYVETVIFNITVLPNMLPEENMHDVLLRPFDPNRRNDPVYYYRGSEFHVTDVVGFIQGVAATLGLKPTYY